MNLTLVKSQIRTDLPEFGAGDNISVTYKIEGDRSQTFTGIVLYVKGSGISKNFCIRKIAVNTIGVEKIMPLNSPLITKIKVNSKGKVRRAKLYYMRDRVGKAALRIDRATGGVPADEA